MLLFIALFPYGFAESGAGSYARAHRLEAALQVVVALALLWVAWQCMRRSFSMRVWTGIAAAAILAPSFRGFLASTKVPAGIKHVGSNWYVTVTNQPGEIDPVYYGLYYKHARQYESVEQMASEYRYVPPDCIVYRGLVTIGRPVYGMCGYRIPVETFDTNITEDALLRWARGRPAYRDDWRYRR